MIKFSGKSLKHVIPAKAGIHEYKLSSRLGLSQNTNSWTPACAGVTGWGGL